MNLYEEKVRDFQVSLGVDVDSELSVDLLKLRKRLLHEEVEELNDEIDNCIEEISNNGIVKKESKSKLFKEMADVQYVLSGMAVTFGIPMDKIFERVHESNISKLDDEGKPIKREDGKVLKGPNYHLPNLDDLV